jgi:hypothetical protein
MAISIRQVVQGDGGAREATELIEMVEAAR